MSDIAGRTAVKNEKKRNRKAIHNVQNIGERTCILNDTFQPSRLGVEMPSPCRWGFPIAKQLHQRGRPLIHKCLGQFHDGPLSRHLAGPH